MKTPAESEAESIDVDKNSRKNKISKLLKVLQGLKISPKRFKKRFSAHILGLEKDDHEPCLYTWRKGGKIVFIVFHVDDMLIRGKDPDKMKKFEEKLKEVFEMKDLDEVTLFLGKQLHRDRKTRIL